MIFILLNLYLNYGKRFTFCIVGKNLKYFEDDQSSWSSQGSVSFAALGPNAVQRPKPVKARSNARIVTAIETAGSGADDKVCINFAKFVNNLCISSYTIAK